MWPFLYQHIECSCMKIFARICFELLFSKYHKKEIPVFLGVSTEFDFICCLFLGKMPAIGKKSTFIVWSISHVYCIFTPIAPLIIWYIKSNFNSPIFFCKTLSHIFLPIIQGYEVTKVRDGNATYRDNLLWRIGPHSDPWPTLARSTS